MGLSSVPQSRIGPNDFACAEIRTLILHWLLSSNFDHDEPGFKTTVFARSRTSAASLYMGGERGRERGRESWFMPVAKQTSYENGYNRARSLFDRMLTLLRACKSTDCRTNINVQHAVHHAMQRTKLFFVHRCMMCILVLILYV